MIVVDASALVAIALGEPEQAAFFNVLERAESARISPINFVESGIILRRYGVISDAAGLERWLSVHGVTLMEANISAQALSAYFRFGKGRHPARLNLADCFAYALAKHLDAPLLYKGDDFSQTDVRSAL